MDFSISEVLVISSIVILMALECINSARSTTWIEVYKPTLFVTLILAFYALFGPLRAIFSSGENPNFVGSSGTIYRMFEHRDVLIYGWIGTLVFYSFFLIGFYLIKPRTPNRKLSRSFNVDLRSARAWGILFCCIALAAHLYVKLNSSFVFPGLQLVPLLEALSVKIRGFENYFVLLGDLFIPGILLQFCVWLRKRNKTIILASWFVIASLIYLNQGFRYKLLLLLAPAFLLWLFYLKRRPKLVIATILMVLFIGLSGLVSVWRLNSRASHIEMQDLTPFEIFISSFEEAGTFFTSSLVLSLVPAKYPYIGSEPIIATLLHPIPRQLFLHKPSGDYTYRIQDDIYTTKGTIPWKSHTAFLSFVEYYLIAGWSSLVLISLALGALMRGLWSWFLLRQYEPVAQSIYLLNACYLYSVLSRGYLPQVVMAYCILILPMYLVYRRLVSKHV